ncbi:hypothetical protein C4565_09455 [Candidatus Parcubacteria bacterium]|jgi:hypothetical protein|nr:MAG: hypothetical protein C4565_09455 [Candidatus Parcubacteria bacterium]
MKDDSALVVDLEEFCKDDKKVPKGKRYQIRIDKEKYVVDSSDITGKQLLELAGKIPTERYAIYQQLKGGKTLKVEETMAVDLCAPGVERFMTLPLDQTEGC